MYAKNEKIYPAYVSKQKSNLEKKVILLMISKGEGWHYHALKKLSSLSILYIMDLLGTAHGWWVHEGPPT